MLGEFGRMLFFESKRPPSHILASFKKQVVICLG